MPGADLPTWWSSLCQSWQLFQLIRYYVGSQDYLWGVWSPIHVLRQILKMWWLQIGVHRQRQRFLECNGDIRTTLSDWWCSQSSYFRVGLFQRISNNSPQQWCRFCHCGKTGLWRRFAMVFLAEESVSWATHGSFSVCNRLGRLRPCLLSVC